MGSGKPQRGYEMLTQPIRSVGNERGTDTQCKPQGIDRVEISACRLSIGLVPLASGW